MQEILLRVCISLWVLIGMSPVTRAESSEPPNRPRIVQQLDQTLEKLDLTDEQRAAVDQVLEDLARQLDRLRQQASLDSLREETVQTLQQARDRLNEVLTPEQSGLLDQWLPGRFGSSDPGANNKMMSSTDSSLMEMSMTGENLRTSPTPATLPASQSEGSKTTQSPALSSLIPGMPVPVFTLNTLDKKTVSLTKYRGKPVVLIFGSFTSPTFRDKVPAFNALKKEFRNKAHFVVIYTREAYPNNEWEVQRNLNEQIRINQHTTLEERLQIARMTVDGLKIDTDVLVDDMDDGVATKYDALPNGCVILDAQGRLIRKQKWADPHTVRIVLNNALKTRD